MLQVFSEIENSFPLYRVEQGCPKPLGASLDQGGVNFSVFSQDATLVELLLFAHSESVEPFQVIRLDPTHHRTFHFWHVYVHNLKPGTFYAYRVDGSNHLSDSGHRFNPNKLLIDPYARLHSTTLWDREAACNASDNLASAMRSIVVDISAYDWEGDTPLNRLSKDTIIYEMHVGGFTQSPTSGCAYPGTFNGIIEKIPYLQALGITAIELLPVFAFDGEEVLRIVDDKCLTNYWGYSTVAFFAPHLGFCTSKHLEDPINEFRDMVKALHRAGIEVILDVVFNHTNEGNHLGPTISFKGFANRVYYFLVPFDQQYYMDYSGTGNTLNCNHPIVERLIVDCLEFWVQEMHVDGFRFDEASILSRGENGLPIEHPPVLWHIENSTILANTKIFVEAWDAAGLNQVGNFPGYRYGEWNGQYRDNIRKFVKGDPGMIGAVASALSGSANIYQSRGHMPTNSINFITCHDGFTLNDLVSYDHKHNDANGEGNRDGMDNNLSWNCGAEGETTDLDIELLRERQIRNFAVILLLSQGVPMILAGDEVRRTQGGNNNAYCQNNSLSWFNWALIEKHRVMLEFFQQLIAFRHAHPSLRRRRFFDGSANERGILDISWHGIGLWNPGWNDPQARALAFTLGGVGEEADIHVMFNMYWGDLEFEVPILADRKWYQVIDTANPNVPIKRPDLHLPLTGKLCRVGYRSAVVLISQ